MPTGRLRRSGVPPKPVKDCPPTFATLRWRRLSLAELEAAPSLGASVFLAFHCAWIACQEAAGLERRTQGGFIGNESTADAVANRASLARQSTSRNRYDDIELSVPVGGNQGLAQNHSQHRAREVYLLIAAVDRDLTAARLDPHARDRILATPGGIGTSFLVPVRLGLIAGICLFRHLRLDQRRLEFTKAFYVFRHGPSSPCDSWCSWDSFCRYRPSPAAALRADAPLRDRRAGSIAGDGRVAHAAACARPPCATRAPGVSRG